MSADDTPNADTKAAAAFAAANLRAWADYVEKTGDGLRVEPYSISVDVPLDRHIGMAPLASSGSVGWRCAPKLQHRNRRFGDHGSLWSDHHKHGMHEPLPDLDAPPAEPEPPCPHCTLALYICRCDEDDLREAILERDVQIADKDAQIKTLTAERDEARGHLRAEMDEALTVRRASGAARQEQTALVVEQTARWARTLEARVLDGWCYMVGESGIESDDRLRSCPWSGCQIWLTTDPCYDEIEYDEHGFATTTVPTIPDAAATVIRRCIVDLFDELTAAAENNAPCPRCDSPSGPYNGFGLAGGGFGAYAGCYACDVIVKVQTPDDDADDAPEGA